MGTGELSLRFRADFQRSANVLSGAETFADGMGLVEAVHCYTACCTTVKVPSSLQSRIQCQQSTSVNIVGAATEVQSWLDVVLSWHLGSNTPCRTAAEMSQS